LIKDYQSLNYKKEKKIMTNEEIIQNYKNKNDKQMINDEELNLLELFLNDKKIGT